MGEGSQKQKIAREFSAGGVVFRKDKNRNLWLITKAAVLPKSFYSSEIWRLPKGWIDNEKPTVPGPMASGKIKANEESLQKSAIREVAEEAGVEATIVRKIGLVKFFFNSKIRGGNVLKFVTFYLMKWAKDVPEGFDEETSEVAWLPFDQAYQRLAFPGEKQILEKARAMV